jgi:D-alanyl-D-alanine carboxypeptidase/D-alanyl-D-alanine-endopeptidase (penicillin-binding protein 4)
VKTDKPLFQYNEKKRFVSASNMKLFTSAAALLSLSPNFTYETKVMTDGIITSGVLKGNLIISASGDPTISGYFNKNNPTQVFEDWADALMKKGIIQIAGDIVVDNSYFNDSPFGIGWLREDMDRCYSASKDAFSFNNNCIALTVSPGEAAGKPAKIEVEPKTGYVTVLNTIKTSDFHTEASVKGTYINNSNTIAMSGTIPLNHENIVRYVAAKNPAEFGAYVLKETLLSKGIEFNGKIYCTRGGCTQAKDLETLSTDKGRSSLNTLAVYRSPELSEIIKVINKISNNLYTELLFLTIAKSKQKEGNSGEAALAVQEILKNAGLDTEGFYMVDGSGLSRLNHITPQQTVQLLKIMAKSSFSDTFYNSLAIPDEEGTLKNWPKGTLITGNVRAKTGTMTHVRNLSGYVTTKDGELLAFSFLCNDYNGPRAAIDGLYNRILLSLVDFSRK